ncbi:ABC transporter ATP-binding protein [Pelistega sp. NLN82]|uniref:ABC transporter ATP-binding protein n=1 Tax=Pelistega ratti TaxID=2652177 RepID=A0A6L9Y4N2_9BURK|nr:ABC transporter ATP-binding protein [Pelistega ratti]NEN75313.1 ABC transporter ATP-binding protein [Pelistega ratti]
MNKALWQTLPQTIRQRILLVGLGWTIVAAVESIVYLCLAYTIMYHQDWKSLASLAILSIVITIVVTRFGFLSGVYVAGNLYRSLGEILSKIKLSWFTTQTRSQINTMAGQGIPFMMSIPAHQLKTLIYTFFLPFFICIGMLGLFGFMIGGLAFVLIISAFIFQYLLQRFILQKDKSRNTTNNQVQKHIMQFVDAIDLFRTLPQESTAITHLVTQWQNQEKHLSTINNITSITSSLLTLISVLPLIVIAIYLIIIDNGQPALMVALFILILRASTPLVELVSAALHWNDWVHILKEYATIYQAPTLEQSHATTIINTYDISLSNIRYKNLNINTHITIPFGNRVWLRGDSASGKSSLLSLLIRFDDVEQGEITIGSIPIQQIAYEDLIKTVAYVEQETVLFTGTLAQNISLGRDIPEEEIEKVARQMALSDVIDRSPLGIHQSIGRQGEALSGGEKQRVALARALLKKAPILLLDEVTSALDIAIEKEVVQALLSYQGTIIFVTHRGGELWQGHQEIMLSSHTKNKNTKYQYI